MRLEAYKFRDVKVSVFVGGAAELFLILRPFVARPQLIESHFWLDLLQLPGAAIAERIFRYVGRPIALGCTFFIQWILFTTLTLGAVYLYRLIRARSQE